MRIIRFLEENGSCKWGVPVSDRLEEAAQIEGDLFGEFEVTEKISRVGELLPPVAPPNIMGIGLNYARHADEQGVSYPDIPVLFLKATTSLNAHLKPILLPAAGPDQVDFEAELAVIIKKKCKNVSEENALDYVLGYTCANDVSARDWQKLLQKKQWTRGKSFDSFCPLGPVLVTTDELVDPHRLRIRSWVNDTLYQDSNTADMIFKIPRIISNLSRSITLLPGTTILTGTPEGVGFARKPQVFLKVGDRVRIRIEEIGELENPVLTQPLSG